MLLILLPLVFSCSSGKPPEALITENIQKMVMVDRAMNFDEEVKEVDIVSMKAFEDLVEVEVNIEGWATHRDLVIGATLPVSSDRRHGWARWKFFCRKMEKEWVIVEKYKVAEGFEDN